GRPRFGAHLQLAHPKFHPHLRHHQRRQAMRGACVNVQDWVKCGHFRGILLPGPRRQNQFWSPVACATCQGMHRLNLACLSVLALGLVCFNLHAGAAPSRTEREVRPLTETLRDKAQIAKGLDAVRLAANTSPERPDTRKPKTRKDTARDVAKRRAEA